VRQWLISLSSRASRGSTPIEQDCSSSGREGSSLLLNELSFDAWLDFEEWLSYSSGDLSDFIAYLLAELRILNEGLGGKRLIEIFRTVSIWQFSSASAKRLVISAVTTSIWSVVPLRITLISWAGILWTNPSICTNLTSFTRLQITARAPPGARPCLIGVPCILNSTSNRREPEDNRMKTQENWQVTDQMWMEIQCVLLKEEDEEHEQQGLLNKKQLIKERNIHERQRESVCETKRKSHTEVPWGCCGKCAGKTKEHTE
jgi:hypothetical protein